MKQTYLDSPSVEIEEALLLPKMAEHEFLRCFPKCFFVMSMLMTLRYSLIKVCHQYLVQETKDQGVMIVVAVGKDKGAQGSSRRG